MANVFKVTLECEISEKQYFSARVCVNSQRESCRITTSERLHSKNASSLIVKSVRFGFLLWFKQILPTFVCVFFSFSPDSSRIIVQF